MSLLMVRKSAPAHAADAHIDDIAYKYKVGDKIKTPDGVGTVQKKTHTNSGKPAYEVKLDKGGIVVHVEQSVSAANDAAPKFRIGQEVIVKTKYTEPYRARIVGLWDMSKNGPYDEQGYLIKNIKGGGVESMPEHALSLATAKDAAADDGNFKVGDKIRLKQMPSGSPFYKIEKIEGNRLYVRKNGELVYFTDYDSVKANDSEATDAAACDDKIAEYEAAYRKDPPEVRARKMRTAKALGDKKSLEMYERVDRELGRVTHDAAEVKVGGTVLVSAGCAADSVDGTGTVVRVFDSGDIEVSFGDAGTVRVPQGHFIGA